MHTTVRIYRGAKPLAQALAEREIDVKNLLAGVAGLVSYQLIQTNEGFMTVTTCENSEGAAESTRVAAEFIRKELPNLLSSPPEVLDGKVAVSLDRSKTSA